jgi:hypothetical protein|tara:strand:- start:630 stop:1310 length:681 start_codon:yes stop_codon:yes gene_type:complete
MNWKKDNYTIIKKAITPEMAEFLKIYLLMKRRVLQTFTTMRYLSEFNSDWGTWGDPQVPGTYSHYGDIAMETLLTKLKPKMEKITGTKLYENYSYARIYKVKDILRKHKDRFSCEISTTLHLGGDINWPIYLNPNPEEGGNNPTTGQYMPSKSKGVKVNLKPGDMLVYRGQLLEHWREPYTGNYSAQVFLHYNDVKTPGSEENALDRRPHLGLPSKFKRVEKKIPR